MGSTRSETLSLRWAMIVDSAEEFLMVGHDNGSTADGVATAGYRPPLRATLCLLGEATSASPFSGAHLRARDSSTAKQAHRQASRYHGPVTRAATKRARTRSGEDPSDGLRLHSSLGQEYCSPASHEGGPMEATTTKPLSASSPLTVDVSHPENSNLKRN
jgi:hypothetical protein